MSRLTWGAPAERYYETGVDRGVLYTTGNPGVPWNGLVSISESPSGGEPKPAYLDGIKFRNIASREEFEASLEAFSAPREFGPCDGQLSLQNGLIATQQPRKSFHLSYRTLIGSALTADAGYKIHLVYNALAQPPNRTNNTQSNSIEAETIQWDLSTLAPNQAGFKPTAHFIVDTRYTASSTLELFEDVLYGTDEMEARMPTVAELVLMFQGE